MEGRVWVESEVGQGSTFHFTARFTLPAEQPAGGIESACPPLGEFGSEHVLLVDYHTTSREMYEELLAALGVRVTSAPSVRAAARHLSPAPASQPPITLVVVVGRSNRELSAARIAQWISAACDTRTLPLLLLPAASNLETPIQTGNWARVQQATAPLPACELRTCLQQLLNPASRWVPEPIDAAAHAPVRPLQILLAEDCLVNREVAIGLLQLRGHEVQVAETGREAVEAVGRHEFDVVLMDIEMPDMDGLDATRAIRDREKKTSGGHLPIIAMTAHADHGFQAACCRAGMDGYVSKPVEPQSLYRAVESLAGDRPVTIPCQPSRTDSP